MHCRQLPWEAQHRPLCSVRVPFGLKAQKSIKNGFSNVRLLETEVGIYGAIAPWPL